VSAGDVFHQAAALKAFLFPAEEGVPSGAAMSANTEKVNKKSIPAYQVALSFAGERRHYVDAVARSLQARGIAVFYDRFEPVTLWGRGGGGGGCVVSPSVFGASWGVLCDFH